MSCKVAISVAIFALVSVVALYSLHTYTQSNTDTGDRELFTTSTSKKSHCSKKHPIKINDVTIESDVPSQVVCMADDEISLEIHGKRFLDYKGKSSAREVSFTLGGTKASSVKLLDCKSRGNKKPWWWRWWKRSPVCQKCSEALVTFPPIKNDKELIQSVSLVAKNPKPCVSTASYPITVINEKRLNFSPTVTPTTFCNNKGPYQLDVVGEGFLWIKDEYSERKPEVFWMDETTPSPVTMDESSCTDVTKVEGVTVYLCTHFTATVANIATPPSEPRVVIVNAAPCQSAAVTQSVTVSTGSPINVIAVSPSLIHNDITIQIAIIISGLPADQTITNVIFKQDDQSMSFTPDPMTTSSRVPVTIPRLQLPGGVWDIVVVASGGAPGCHATLPSGLTVIAQTANFDSMKPIIPVVEAN